jgi:ABC-2 type transport system permease protein
MGQTLIILKKELKELLTSRSAVLSGIAMALFFSVMYGMLLTQSNKALPAHALDGAMFTLSAMLGVFMSYSFTSQVFLREKMAKVTETLLCAPVSLRQIWLGKTLAVSMLSYVISLAGMVTLLTVASAKNGAFIAPSLATVFHIVFVVPAFIAAFGGLVGLAQMAMGMKENQIFGLIIFLPLFIGLNTIMGMSGGVTITWWQVGLALTGSLILLTIASFLTRFLSRERIVVTLA